MLLMLLLLDTDGGEKKFNSLLIYSLPIKTSVNVNYPNHFHLWHMKTEKSECLYFLSVEEKLNWKYFQYLRITYSFHSQCSDFLWSLDTNNSHQTKQENLAAHSLSTAGQKSSEVGQGRKCPVCPTHPMEQLWSCGLTPAPLKPLQSRERAQEELWH